MRLALVPNSGQIHRLSYAGNEAARRFCNGDIDAASATQWLTRYALMPPDRATQRLAFFTKYRFVLYRLALV